MEEKTNMTLQEERVITSEERIWLIQTVINTKGLHGLLEEIEKKFASKNNLTQEEKTEENKVENAPQQENKIENVDNKTYNYVEDSGMYEKDALSLVVAEFGSNISKEKQNSEISSEIRDIPKQEEQGPVNQLVQNEVETSLNEENQDEVLAKPLTRVKELENKNPWSEARTVSPGEIKL